MSSVYGWRRLKRKLWTVSASNFSSLADPKIGSIHAESASPIIRHAANDGQRRHLLLAPDSIHFHIQVTKLFPFPVSLLILFPIDEEKIRLS